MEIHIDMLKFKDFFAQIENFPCPELFEEKLEGFDDLVFAWDILKRIQKGFVKGVVKPGIHGEVKEGAIIEGDDIYIGKGSVIHPGALVCGPTIIGENVEIRHCAYVRGNVIIGDGAVVGHCSETVRSVFLPGAKAPHFNYVGDSVLGTDVNLGAGTKLSNLKNDGTNIITKWKNERKETGIRKFGAILGDGCQLGCNSVTNPGTVMEPGCRVYPCAMVHGYMDKNTIFKLRQRSAKGTAE